MKTSSLLVSMAVSGLALAAAAIDGIWQPNEQSSSYAWTTAKYWKDSSVPLAVDDTASFLVAPDSGEASESYRDKYPERVNWSPSEVGGIGTVVGRYGYWITITSRKGFTLVRPDDFDGLWAFQGAFPFTLPATAVRTDLGASDASWEDCAVGADGARVIAAWSARSSDGHLVVRGRVSSDGGATWSEPKMALDIDGPLRTFDPAMWTDPEGRVWLFWCQTYDVWDGRGGLWASVCEHPDDEDAAWSKPRRICDGVMKNKPLVLSNGDRWLFVEQWRDDCQENYWKRLCALPSLPAWYHADTPHVGANVYRSTDRGETWRWFATVPVPGEVRTCDEHMAIEQRNGAFRMLLRVKKVQRTCLTS